MHGLMVVVVVVVVHVVVFVVHLVVVVHVAVIAVAVVVMVVILFVVVGFEVFGSNARTYVMDKIADIVPFIDTSDEKNKDWTNVSRGLAINTKTGEIQARKYSPEESEINKHELS